MLVASSPGPPSFSMLHTQKTSRFSAYNIERLGGPGDESRVCVYVCARLGAVKYISIGLMFVGMTARWSNPP